MAREGESRLVGVARAAGVAVVVAAVVTAVALAQPGAVAPVQNETPGNGTANDSAGNVSANDSVRNASERGNVSEPGNDSERQNRTEPANASGPGNATGPENASVENASETHDHGEPGNDSGAQAVRATQLDRAIHETALAGGEAYDGAVTRAQATVVATNREQLIGALSTAQPGDVVFVPGNASVNLTGAAPVWVPERVTLASDRGVDGSPGALLHTDEGRSGLPLLVTGGERTRITGFRLRGYGHGWTPATRDRPSAWGILVPARASQVTIDNNDISNFVGICVQIAGNHTSVHHNRLSHCNKVGLGYGVNVGQHAVVECNYVDHVRHAIAAHGGPGNAYVARFNVIGRHAQNHAFDVHTPGGAWVNIYHNTVMAVYRYGAGNANVASVSVGASDHVSRVHHNWFFQNATLAIWQNETRGPPFTDDRYRGLDVHGNAFGLRSPPAAAGAFATRNTSGHGSFESTCG